MQIHLIKANSQKVCNKMKYLHLEKLWLRRNPSSKHQIGISKLLSILNNQSNTV